MKIPTIVTHPLSDPAAEKESGDLTLAMELVAIVMQKVYDDLKTRTGRRLAFGIWGQWEDDDARNAEGNPILYFDSCGDEQSLANLESLVKVLRRTLQ